jgi:tryptophan synthase alpha chain
MKKLEELFARKKKDVLNVYCTAGFPEFESTISIMRTLEQNGVDIIELGMPYSDPLADGPVIQASGNKALQNGMTIGKLFEQLQDFRKQITVPIILMGYLNPVLQFGFEKFCRMAADLGLDGLIIPDLPEYEFETQYAPLIKRYELDFIFLVTPETSEDRIRKLDSLSSGFLYAVSSSSITGKEKDFSAVEKYLKRLQSLKLNNPVLVGFGIKDRDTFESACKFANGAIIGTAFIKALESSKNIENTIEAFVGDILKK